MGVDLLVECVWFWWVVIWGGFEVRALFSGGC